MTESSRRRRAACCRPAQSNRFLSDRCAKRISLQYFHELLVNRSAPDRRKGPAPTPSPSHGPKSPFALGLRVQGSGPRGPATEIIEIVYVLSSACAPARRSVISPDPQPAHGSPEHPIGVPRKLMARRSPDAVQHQTRRMWLATVSKMAPQKPRRTPPTKQPKKLQDPSQALKIRARELSPSLSPLPWRSRMPIVRLAAWGGDRPRWDLRNVPEVDARITFIVNERVKAR
jgi:hypothetical protein